MRTPLHPTVAPFLAALVCAGCGKADGGAAKAIPPAKIAKIVQEEQLNTIVLTPEAEKRLGITLATLKRQEVSRVRSYGGEVVLPPGASLVISAPVGGTLHAPESGSPPTVGTLVSAKQPVFKLLPLLSPERDVLTPAERINLAQAKNALATSRIEAAGQVQQAQVQADAAKIAFERAERLFSESAGAKKSVDDAQAQLDLATKALEAAQSRQKLIDSINLEGEAGQQVPLIIEAPQAGMIRSQSAASGEVVAAGAPLFEVMKFDPIWIRVPIYGGEIGDLAPNEPAEIFPLSANERTRSHPARAITAPPTAALLAATVDLYYELPNPEAQFRPAQRVTAKVKLTGTSEQLVVPWSAVIHDIHGGTWIYENTAPHTYVRRRVQVRHVADGLAVLEAGPPAGAKIVTTALMELFGAEFGFAK
jgi:RND family efflux transporter MFP subunit